MDSAQRFVAGLRLLAGRLARWVWLLWALAVALLVLTPFALLDPAAWAFLLDHEPAAIVALVGFAGIRAGLSRRIWQPLLALARASDRCG